MARLSEYLAEEMDAIAHKIETRLKDKMESERAQLQAVASKSNSKELKQKVDIEVFETVRSALESVTSQLGNLQKLQKKELMQVKRALEESLGSALKQMVQRQEEPNATATTRALCLSCGRESTIHMGEPLDPPAPSNLVPSLSASAQPGPDILRGGFKIPVHVPAPPAPLDAQKNPGRTSEDDEPPLPQPHRVTTSATVSMSMSLPQLPSGPAAMSMLKVSAAPMSRVRGGGQGRGGEEAGAMLRPIHRKGFPTRKTARAETTYAPERYYAHVRETGSEAAGASGSGTIADLGSQLVARAIGPGK